MPLYLLDTGALISNWVQKNPQAKLLTSNSIIEEIRNHPSIQRVESLISISRLIIKDPQSHCIRAVTETAQETGDLGVLSPQDIDLLGLAYQFSREGTEVIVVSTDLALLNTARAIGVKVLDPRGKMKHDIRWTMKCPACGYTSPNVQEDVCAVCGTKMRRYPSSRRKIE
ncbi:MAG: NOB1 family endonuclease [Candidatus Thorarchaeota archaeon]